MLMAASMDTCLSFSGAGSLYAAVQAALSSPTAPQQNIFVCECCYTSCCLADACSHEIGQGPDLRTLERKYATVSAGNTNNTSPWVFESTQQWANGQGESMG